MGLIDLTAVYVNLTISEILDALTSADAILIGLTHAFAILKTSDALNRADVLAPADAILTGLTHAFATLKTSDALNRADASMGADVHFVKDSGNRTC